MPEPLHAQAVEASGNACALPCLREGVPTDRTSPFAVEDQAIPATVGLFGASKSTLDAVEPFRYAAGAESLSWNGDTFVRVESAPATEPAAD